MKRSHNDKMRMALLRVEQKARKLQEKLDAQFKGQVVQLRVAKREWHGGSRHPAGRRFRVHRVLFSGLQSPFLWLRRADKNYPTLDALSEEVDFIEEGK